MAQVDYFLKIDGVESESTDDKYKGWIELESFSWGQTNSGTAGHGAGQGAGKVVPQDFHFVKKVDKSTPVLFIGCATGQHFKKAEMVGRKAGGKQVEYFKATFEDVLISSYQLGGSSHGDVVPTEQLSLNFAKLEMIYKEQKADGSLGGDVKQKYDYAANKKI
jgi:type VI secretion system secreted protein Hcp